MPSRIALIWALATSAIVVVAGAAAAYWLHPSFLWPNPIAGVVADRAAAPTATAGPPASTPAASAAITAAAPSASAAQPAPSAASTEPLAPAAAPDAAAPASAAKPAFDVVTVEPTGEAVVAGRAPPNAKVELRDAGRTVADATTNAAGQFVIVPPALAPGGHSLSLAVGAGKSAAETSKPIAVAVPAPAAKAVVAAVAPTKPTRPEPAAAAAAPATESKTVVAAIAPAKPAAPEPPVSAASAATPLTTPAPAAATRVAIQSVEANPNGGLAVKGAADSNGVVRLYLNGAFVADAKTKADGRWSLTVEHGMTAGAYVMRADEINPADAKVLARAEAPFSYPEAPAPNVAAPPAANAPVMANAAPAAASSADVVVDSVRTARVVHGDTLWGLSHTYYGDGTRYRLIFAANTSQIRDPHWIYPGQLFVVPQAEAKP